MTRQRNDSGVILIVCMVIVLTFSVMGLALAQTIAAQFSSYRKRLFVENSISAADAGVSATLAQLSKNSAYAGFSTEQELYSSADRGRATYTTTVTTDAGQNKIVVSTGRTYKLQTDTVAANTKTVQAVARLKRDKISDSFIIGSGGMYMMGNSKINKGSVYIRGQLSMEAGTSVGSASVPVTMNIANVGCGTSGASSNWPQPCGASDPPIKMIGAGGTIYGTVCATNQVSTAGINPTSGLTPNCVSRISSAPTFNKKAFVDSINTSGGTVVNGSYSPCGWGGDYVIPANTKIIGDLNLESSFSACNITLEGDLYITGVIKLGANATLKVSENLGTTKPTVVTNGGIWLAAANARVLANSFGTPLFVITFSSTNSTCSANETVPSDIQQTCLTNDQARSSAIVAAFSPGAGSGTVDMSGAIFYGYYGGFSIQSTNLTWAFYAFGAQGGRIANGSQLSMTAAADVAPFGSLLYTPTYQMIDYKQIY